MKPLIFAFIFFLSACSAMEKPSLDYNGSGNITLSREVQVMLLKYKSEKFPETLAVSIDGKHGGYNYCPENECKEEGRLSVLSYCESISNGIPCRIYAHKGKIVWNYDLKTNKLFNRTFDDNFHLNWEGYKEPMKGTVENIKNFKVGYMRVMLPESKGKCRGLFDMNNKEGGYWNLSCDNGDAASGKLVFDGTKTFGTGVDQKGKKVSLAIEGTKQ